MSFEKKSGAGKGRESRRRDRSAYEKEKELYYTDGDSDGEDVWYGEDYSEEYYSETGEGYGDEEYYSDDDGEYEGGEYYSETEEEEAAELYCSETGEEYGDEEYYSDDDGEYEGGEYYSETEEEEAAELYYSETGEEYGGEEYYSDDDGEYEGGEYYSETEEEEAAELYCSETGEGYGDEEYYSDGEYEGGEYYYEDEEGYEDTDPYYYADDEEECFSKGRKSRGKNGASNGKKRKPAPSRGGLWYRLIHMSAIDRVVASTGVLILVLALITCTMYVNAKVEDKQVSSFADIGTQLDGIEIVGETGIMAVVGAGNAQEQPEEEDVQPEEASGKKEEEKQQGGITVGMNFTSIEKDLKIKFVNQKTNKLIASVPFEVTMTDAGGNTYSLKDDDEDGIIYQKDLKPGKYEIAMASLENYEDYQFSSEASSVTVKDKIEYKKVDVADEVKKESEVNVAVEDTAKKETVVESTLKDTVEWVESSAASPDGADISAAKGYEEVPKDHITDPLTYVSGAVFTKFTGEIPSNPVSEPVTEPDPGNEPAPAVSLDQSGITLTVGGSATLTAYASPEGGTLTWSSDNDGVASVGGGTVTASSAGSATITAVYTLGDKTASASCSVTVSQPEAPAKPRIELNASNANLKVGDVFQLSAVVYDAPVSSVSWSSSNTSVASVSGGSVTALSAGTAVITAACDADPSVTASCTVNVETPAKVTLTLNTATLDLKTGESAKLSASVGNTSDTSVNWASDKDAVATVSGDGTVNAVSEGKAVIRAVSGADSSVSAACTVTVHPVGKPSISLNKTDEKIFTDNTLKLEAVVTNAENKEVRWASDKDAVAAVSSDGTVKGISAGTAVVRAVCKADESVTATCKITVKQNPKTDRSTPLKDNDGNKLYVKDSSGNFREAVFADYYTDVKFYKQVGVDTSKFKYTGWQTLDGRTYFFDKNGNKVTGEQIIQGAKYNFNSDGSLNTGSGSMGIDVSKWNGSINWNEVRNSGVSYAIIRCGYRGSTTGALIEDPQFRANIKGAAAAGLKIGVYFFTQAVNEAEAVEEASMVVDMIRGYNISYPVFLDVEVSGGRGDRIDAATRTAVCAAFCRTMQDSGYKAGIYANKTWLNEKINTGSLTNYKIWLAQYAAQPTYSKTKYDLWQYTSKGSVGGIKGNVDMNISYLGY